MTAVLIVLVLTAELEKRRDLLNKMQDSLELQPGLEKKTREKIKANEIQINSNNDYRRRLMTLTEDLALIIKANFEMNNTLAADAESHPQYILVAAFYIAMCAKYPSDIKLKLFKGMLNSLPDSLDFDNHTIYEILYNEAYLIECMKKKVPLCLSFVDNLAIYDLLQEIVMPYPLVIDPSGLFIKFLRAKHDKNLKVESYSTEASTIANIENAIVNGQVLALVNFDQDLLRIVEPLIDMKYEALVHKLYKKHLFNEEEKENGPHENDEPELVFLDEKNEEIIFHGKKLKMHNNFRLVLILRDSHMKLPKILLEKVFLINNDISHEGTWKELASDIVLNYCYQQEKDTHINKYFKEKLFNDANEEFNMLCVKCERQMQTSNFDVFFVEELEEMTKNIKKKYQIENMVKTNDQGKNQRAVASDNLGATENNTLEESKQPPQDNLTLRQKRDSNLKSAQDSIIIEHPPADNTLNIVATASDNKLTEGQSDQDSMNFLKDPRHMLDEDMRDGAHSVRSYNSKRSFFNNSRGPNSMQESANSSLFLEGKKVSDYCNFFSKFKEIEELLSKHSAMINQLHLIHQTLVMVHKSLGNLYGLSEYFSLISLQHALEIGIANGYLKNTLKKDDQVRINEFNTMVVLYYYHQIYSSLRSDHQNVFSAFFAVIFLKCTQDFQQKVWDYFLRGPVDRRLLREYFESPEMEITWYGLREAIIGFNGTCENSFPPLLSYEMEGMSATLSSAGANKHYSEGEKPPSSTGLRKSIFSKETTQPVQPRSAQKHLSLMVPGSRSTMQTPLSGGPKKKIGALLSLQAGAGASKDFSFSRSVIRHLTVNTGSKFTSKGLLRDRIEGISKNKAAPNQLQVIQDDDKIGIKFHKFLPFIYCFSPFQHRLSSQWTTLLSSIFRKFQQCSSFPKPPSSLFITFLSLLEPISLLLDSVHNNQLNNKKKRFLLVVSIPTWHRQSYLPLKIIQ